MDWPETKCPWLWFGLPVQGDVQMKNKGKIKFKNKENKPKFVQPA